MKENSREKDIKILERFSNENVIYGSTVGMTLEKYKDLQLSAEHILSDYKRVLKENEELKNQEATQRKINELLVQRYSNSISIQKVKDKIEELNKQLEEDLQDEVKVNSNRFIIICQCKSCLQELLESRGN